MKTVAQILDDVKGNFGGTIPANANEIVLAMLAEKNLGYKTFDRLEAAYNVTPGFFGAVKVAIAAERAANTVKTVSAAEARVNRIEKYLKQY